MIESRQPPSPLVAVGEGRESFDLEAYQEFVRLSDAGEPAALVTVIGSAGSSPRGMGAAMTVRGDGSIAGTVGGGSLEMLVIGHALDAIQDGRPRRFHYDYSGGGEQNLEKACIGQTDFFIQPSVRRPRLYIFGAGHVGMALASIAQQAGFQVSLADDRPGFPPSGAVPGGVHVFSGTFEEIIAGLRFDEGTYAVIVTYGHARDENVLRACLHKPWSYLGMIGSKAKVARAFESVGIDEASRERLKAVHAPVGLDIGGRSPGEIAVSITAELLAVRHGRDPSRVKPMARGGSGQGRGNHRGRG